MLFFIFYLLKIYFYDFSNEYKKYFFVKNDISS